MKSSLVVKLIDGKAAKRVAKVKEIVKIRSKRGRIIKLTAKHMN